MLYCLCRSDDFKCGAAEIIEWEVDVRIKLFLDEIGIGQRDPLELHALGEREVARTDAALAELGRRALGTNDRWGVPLVHTMHTMARVKNLHLADGDEPEPRGREIGEAQVVEAADRLVANTDREARELIELYDADPSRVAVAEPGVDLAVFSPGSRDEARARVGIPSDTVLLLFVGRIQPLKAPDVLVRAAAELVRRRPDLRSRLVVGILGGASGTGVRNPMGLTELAQQLGIADLVRFVPPVDRSTLAQWYRAADLVAVPSHSESFGLVAVEAQACGTPVVAANVGGLPADLPREPVVRVHEVVVPGRGVGGDPHHPGREGAQLSGQILLGQALVRPGREVAHDDPRLDLDHGRLGRARRAGEQVHGDVTTGQLSGHLEHVDVHAAEQLRGAACRGVHRPCEQAVHRTAVDHSR